MKLALAIVLAAAACGGPSKSTNKPKAPRTAMRPAATAPVASTEPAARPAAKPAMPAPAPAPAPAAPAPEPAPPPAPPQLSGWYAAEGYSVALVDGGTATVEMRGKKISKKKATWDDAASTITFDKKTNQMKVEGDYLYVTIGGTEQRLTRQPTSFDGKTFANEKGSIQLNADGSCVHGQAGKPAMCTYKLENGKLAIKYSKETKKKPVSWVVWFESDGKVLRTPKETFTATE
ncbi:MAG: hypothetical protein SFX73_36890 [Kofleriaceae bacterium]|nr:hypothetical protein [Kofleriaceae bacterium]